MEPKLLGPGGKVGSVHLLLQECFLINYSYSDSSTRMTRSASRRVVGSISETFLNFLVYIFPVESFV
jgi:hypothetical protein